MTADSRYALLIAEYEQMRAEINSRSRIQVHLVFAALAALGAAGSVVETPGDAVVVAAASAVSILSFLWSDHDKQINTIGAYLALRLEPVLRKASGAFAWEPFFRHLDRGGDEAAVELCGSRDSRFWDKAVDIPDDTSIVNEYGLLFYLVPFLLLLIYLGALVRDVQQTGPGTGEIAVRVASLTIAGAIWGWSLYRRQKRITRRGILHEIVAAEG